MTYNKVEHQFTKKDLIRNKWRIKIVNIVDLIRFFKFILWTLCFTQRNRISE